MAPFRAQRKRALIQVHVGGVKRLHLMQKRTINSIA